MDLKKIVVGLLFFIGAYMLMDVFISIIRNDVEQDIKESVLLNELGTVRCLRNVPKNSDRVIMRDLKPGCVYEKSNVHLWNELDNVDNSGKSCEPPAKSMCNRIRDTEYHGDKMMDTSRNLLINDYYNKTMIDMSSVVDVDPYDPEMYASVTEQVEQCSRPAPKPIQKLDKPLTGHSYISKDFCPNPAPVKYPILSDTHYLPASELKQTFIPSALRCDNQPGIDQIVSSNLISDRMLSETIGSYKSMKTNTISHDLIGLDEIQYAPRELVPQYNPMDNNLYKVSDREPVRSMEMHSMNDNVCGFDERYSSYSEIENNDFKETTSA